MFRSLTLVAVTICAVSGCRESDRSQVAGKEDRPLAALPMPAEITVLSGTTFRCGNVPCQLLGVKESADPAVRERAERFTRLWFKSVGNYIGIYNSSNPLMAKDGTSVVWIRGYDTYLSCLSEELVRVGLAEVDGSLWADYTFTVPRKDGEAVEDWLGILRKAKEGHERGEKPHVLFDWPLK
ncbi:hypothetical protein V5E97_13515 [Singulisphaera sp. Ch08]|uniref:Lipoprotein n=1 Tax=Singulisphaera sp. Ch08 TaxID=3120278 RepID=A0AAU7CNH7_9BACT